MMENRFISVFLLTVELCCSEAKMKSYHTIPRYSKAEEEKISGEC